MSEDKINKKQKKKILLFGVTSFLLALIVIGGIQTASMAETEEVSEKTAASTIAAVQTAGDQELYTINIGNEKSTTLSGYFESDLASQAVALVNSYRASHGLASLTETEELIAGADIRACEVQVLASHTRPNGGTWYSACAASYGENIAYGFNSADGVVQAWINSPTHNANLLNANYHTIGISCFAGTITNADGSTQQRYYWAQEFGL